MARCCPLGTGLLLLLLATLAVTAAPPKRVLILDSFGRDVAPFSVGVSAFRTTLARELGQPVDIYEAPLDMARFPGPGFEKPLADLLRQRFAGSPVDVVVPVGAPAVLFAAQYRDQLFPSAQIIFMGADPRRLPPDLLKTNATLVTEKADLPGVIEDILQLQPETTNVVFLFGISPLEKFWAEEFRREWEPFTNQLGFTWLGNLSLPQLQERVQNLPPRSFIVAPMLIMDAEGVPYDGYEGFEAIHAAAKAPVFGCYSSQLGRGAIGGRLYQDGKVGTLAAQVAVRILRGEKAADIQPVIIGSSPPTYDWRELKRWGLRPDRLPAGSVIKFRQPTFWEEHRWRIVGLALFCCLQTGLIVGLLINRAKRREEEGVAALIADLSSRFINLPADQVDREIEAAQQRVCDALGLDGSWLWQWQPDQQAKPALTHYYRAMGEAPSQTMMGHDPFPWVQRRVLAGEVVAISSPAALPGEAVRDREMFSFYGLRTLLTVPLCVGGQPVFGSVSFNDMQRERRWSEVIIQRLQLVAQIFANALARKVAEEALRESEARLSLAADGAAVGLWSLNLATNQYWLTAKSRDLFEFRTDETVTFERFLSAVHPNDRELVGQTVREVMNSGREAQVEYRVLRADGSLRWMLSRGRVYGEPPRLTGTTIDITERKRASDDLRQSEEQYRLLFEQMQSGIIVVEVILDEKGKPVDHRLIQANAEFEAQTGLKRTEQIGRTSAELAFQWPEEVRQRYYGVALGDEPIYWERFNASLRRYYDVRAFSPRRGQFAVLFHDITERKRAEEGLKASEQRFRTLAESSLVGIYVVQDGRFQYVNPAMARIFGYSLAEMSGVSPDKIVETSDHVFVDETRWRETAGEANTVRHEVRGRRKDGSTRHVEVYGSIMEMNGKQALVGTLIDITERKRAEEALREFSGRFIRAQEQERARLARELHDDITQRLARLAIDVGQFERSTGKPHLGTLTSVRDGLIQLSENVHSLSYRLHPSILEDLGLAEALRAEAEHFERQGTTPIEVKMEEIPESILPEASLCLFRVAQEALRNASRHACAHKITLSLRGSDAGLQLAIQDDGCGFDANAKRERPSLGLEGMRERVLLVGGELDIESAPGHGTTVLAWVPLKGKTT